MSSAVELMCSWLRRALALTLVAVGLQACSGEATRFSDNPYGPRNAQTQADVTGSVSSAPAPSAKGVEARPLPRTSQAPAATPVSYSTASTTATTGVVAGGGRGMASYNPDAGAHSPPPTPTAYSSATPVAYQPSITVAPTPAPNPEVTAAVHKPNSHGQWSWDGGTAVTVTPGETVEAIARRHGVPASAILEANNLASPNAIQPGQRLVIPRYLGSATIASLPPHAAAPVAPLAPVSPKPAPTAPAASTVPTTTPASVGAHGAGPGNPEVHVVAAGETLSKIARQYRKSVAELTKANNLQPGARLNIGDRITIPGTRVSKAKGETDEGAAAPAKPAGKEVAAVATPAAEAGKPDAAAGVDATPSFRWPVHGRVIAAFGAKSNGQQNDGIDVAVPENTPIKAAEDGVVAYAGSELKGYGNLVLVRHPNGYVTAYAHAKELLVKKGDPVKRGQVIGKSGQSGNVEAPELHFEVRKGTAPIDPMQFLKGA
jgi:murein DD-endopeptidase MepM/ murein hydrolase activator NlpD